MRAICICMLVLAIGSATAQPHERRPKETKVYYLNLFVDTTVPVDEESIRECYNLTALVQPIVPDILAALSKDSLSGSKDSSNTSYNKKAVRLMIIPPKGKPIFLDRNGFVKGFDRAHWLSVEDRKALRKLIFSALPDG